MAYTAIDDPSAHFQTVLYTGNGSDNLSITNGGNSDLQPDLVWLKNRELNGTDHILYDSTRGVTKQIHTNNQDDENTASGLTDFNSDGFTIDDDGGANTVDDGHVAWQWKANGGTTSTNSDGTVNVTIQVNSTAGFSIMKWTGNGNTSGTVGHGLGAIPDCIILKYGYLGSDGDINWSVAFPKFETGKLLVINSQAAFSDASGLNTYTTSVWTDGNGGNTDGTFAYAFKSIQGYSKFGSYIGNANADGTFIYTGFKPAFFLTKNGTTVRSWSILDNKRPGYNPTDKVLPPNEDGPEEDIAVDFLSNGIKLRQNHTAINENGTDRYVYMAFAHQPFVTSGEVPCTAA